MKVSDLAARRKQSNRRNYADLVMQAWDRLASPREQQAQRIGKPSTLDTDPEVRRKAKAAL